MLQRFNFGLLLTVLSLLCPSVCRAGGITYGNELHRLYLSERSVAGNNLDDYILLPDTLISCIGVEIPIVATLVNNTGAIYRYSWTGPNIVGSFNSLKIRVRPVKTSRYILTVEGDRGVSFKDTVIVDVNEKLLLEIPHMVRVRQGERIEIKPGGMPVYDKISWFSDGRLCGEGDVFTGVAGSDDIVVKGIMSRGTCQVEAACRVVVRAASAFGGNENDGYDETIHQVANAQPVRRGGLDDGHTESVVLLRNLLPKVLGKDDDGYTESTLSERKEFSRVLGDVDDGHAESDPVDRKETSRTLGGVVEDGYAESDVEIETYSEKKMWGGDEDGFAESEIRVRLGRFMPGGFDDGFAESCASPTISRNDSLFAGRGCVSDSIVLTANARGDNLTYEWQKFDADSAIFRVCYAPDTNLFGLNSPTLVIRKLLLETEGRYRCRVYNQCGEVMSDTFMLSVDGVPVLKDSLEQGLQFCLSGDTAVLSVTAISPNGNTLEYNWYKDSILLKGEVYSKAQVKIPLNSIDVRGWYQVVVKNACGQVSDSTYLSVTPPVEIIHYDSLVRTCIGGDAEFRLQLEDTTDYFAVLKEIRMLSDSTYVVKESAVDSGLHVVIPGIDSTYHDRYYIWQVFNDCSRDSSGVIRLVIKDGVEIESQSCDTVVCIKEPLQLYCKVRMPSPGVTYQWYRNGVLTEQVKDTFDLRLVNEPDSGIYICLVTDTVCGTTVESDTIRVGVRIPAEVSGQGVYVEGQDEKTEYVFCPGTTLKLKVDISHPENVDSVRWYKDETVLTGRGSDSLLIDSVKVIDQGNYRVRIFTPCGDIETEPVLIKVIEAKVYQLTIEQYLCADSSGAVLNLSGSQKNEDFYYQLFRKKPDAGWEQTGDSLVGTGRILKWKNVTEGVYKVVAGNKLTGCGFEMENECEVSMKPLPATFDLLAVNGDTVYCLAGTSEVILYLSGSEQGIEYTLIRDSLEIVSTDTVVRWENVIRGIYEVQAENEWGCQVRSGSVEVVGVAPVRVTLKQLADNHVGSCDSINLYQRYQPRVNGVAADPQKGLFFVNETPLPGIWWNVPQVNAGVYKISYLYQESGACVDTLSVILHVDTAVSASLILPSDICEGDKENSVLQIDMSEKGTYDLRYEQIRMNATGIYRRDTITAQVKDRYESAISWLSDDSCIIYTVTGLTDRHNCRVVLSPGRDTIFYHKLAHLDRIKTRYPDTVGGAWGDQRYFDIIQGDSVGVKIRLADGRLPYILRISGADTAELDIQSRDTVLNLKREGSYRFAVTDSFECTHFSTDSVVIRYLKPGYLKMNVLLEGPYDTLTGVMKTSIQSLLPLYGINKLPDAGQPIIDWIVVELRQGNSADSVARKKNGTVVAGRDTCLLLADGTVVDRDGEEAICFPNVYTPNRDHNAYYVTLFHRNHLNVMSSEAYFVSGQDHGDIPFVDFTDSTNIYYSGKTNSLQWHMSCVKKGEWAMSAGEINVNSLISLRNPNSVAMHIGVSGQLNVNYHIHDVNFDGIVDWGQRTDTRPNKDWNLIKRNRHKFTEVR